MSWFAKKLVGEPLKEPIEAIGNVFDKVFTSDEERLQAQAMLEKLRQQPAILQAEINKIEAGHRTIFVAGWRPFIGWVCGTGLAFTFVINPLIQWHTGEPGPVLPLEAIMTLVISILGLGGLRTYEKSTGRAK
ncbi:MAG: 3TM-type holin [Alphaproteobacteria bacterium]|nr:3TM-type holin [Alphaproteobacteria bacterium]MDD9919761.1 3TM-type holin [Alphaproteobacteria bacterium]